MDTFTFSLTLICVAGVIPLLTYRRFFLTKSIYSILTVFGSVLGLIGLISGHNTSGALQYSGTWLNALPLSFSIDSLSYFFIIPVLLIGSLAAVYSFHYFTDEAKGLRVAVSLCCTNILIVSMVMVAAAANMISFALFWEMMSISSFILVLYDHEKQTTRTAGYLYFMFTQAGALFIFAAFGLLFSHTADFSFSTGGAVPEGVKVAVFILSTIGFGSKAGVFPLHIWLPHAHPAAPSHISALMSGVMIKMGVYGIMRMFFMLEPASLILGETILVLGMISGVLGVLYALGKHNIKRLLAYHSVENIGIILIGAGLGMTGVSLGNSVLVVLGFAGALLHILNHSIFKSLLFMGAGMVIKQTGTSHVDEMGGLMKRMPLTGKTFLVGSVSISGLPPFNGFVSEFLIYCGLFNALNLDAPSVFLLATFGILSLAVIGGLASFCFTKVVGIVFLGEPRSSAMSEANEGGKGVVIPMVILAVLCLIIGIFPQPFIALAVSSLADVAQLTASSGDTEDMLARLSNNLAWGSRLFLLLCIISAVARKVLYRGKEVTSSGTWGCGFTQPTVRMQYTGTSYARTVVNIFQPFVRVQENGIVLQKIFPRRNEFTSRVDDIAEIALDRGIVQVVTNFLLRFRWIQHGKIQLYIGYIILTILVLLVALFI